MMNFVEPEMSETTPCPQNIFIGESFLLHRLRYYLWIESFIDFSKYS